MKTSLILTFLLVAVSAAAQAVPLPDLQSILPPGAVVNATMEADLTGDGRSELIIGYALPRSGLPPTEGRAVVLERSATGAYRRFDLPGVWGGHYRPLFRVLDLTGDGRPELVEMVAGDVAWRFLRVFRRTIDGYEMLLENPAQDHVLWDADGDGRVEVIARYRRGLQVDQALQRFRWLNNRFIAWHAPEWTYRDGPTTVRKVPDLKGLTLQEADATLKKAGLSLGVIAELDVPGQPGRVIRFEAQDGEVNVAVPAGNTSFAAPKLPLVATIHYASELGRSAAPIAGTPSDRANWHAWLQRLVSGVEQVVHTNSALPPVYLVELQEPWRVKLGNKTETVRWVGVSMQVPERGLLFLASEDPRPGYRFTAAVYTSAEVQPPPVSAEQPRTGYLEGLVQPADRAKSSTGEPTLCSGTPINEGCGTHLTNHEDPLDSPPGRGWSVRMRQRQRGRGCTAACSNRSSG